MNATKTNKRLIVIGDLQGCFDDFQKLLAKLSFNPKKDTLWLAGDIVNRGTQSLACLRYAKENQDFCKIVLGNHDLHLIAAYHQIKASNPKDTLNDILSAPDAKALIDWLRCQPLMRYHTHLNIAMVHAGIYPSWSINDALNYAQQAQQVLAGDHYLDFINNMYGNQPDTWPNSNQAPLQGVDRIRFIINTFTRMRYIENGRQLNMHYNGAVGTQPATLKPWFSSDQQQLQNTKVVFGHWSTLRIKQSAQFYPIDTGCVWGEKLTALVIDNGTIELISRQCKGALTPF